MTNKEFSDGFSTILNSFGALPNITLDEYEKSVYLTNAQEQLILECYTGKNPKYGSFEQTEETRRYLSNLVETYKTKKKITDQIGLLEDSIFFSIPKDTWFITYESVVLKDERLPCEGKSISTVVPTTQDEFYRIHRNPFKGPTSNRVLRLDIKDNIVELVSKYNVDEYIIRYLNKPTPIILIDLPSELSINGDNKETECILHEALHREILYRAAQLAIISKTQLLGNKEEEEKE